MQKIINKLRLWIIKKLLKDTDGYTYTGFSEGEPIKFYYDENIKRYVVGARSDTMYYTRPGLSGWTAYSSKNLPWGEAYNGYTWGKEPREVDFQRWLFGILESIHEEYMEDRKARR